MLSRYEQFSFVIASIYRGIQKIERDEMVKYGYKGSYAQYLAALTRYPEGLTLLQLCDACEKDKAAVSRAVADMEERGLIVRVSPSGRKSHYRAQLRLTDEGRKISNFVCERAQAAVDAVGSDMGDEQRSVFHSALGLIAANLQTVTRQGIPEEE